MIHVVIAPVLVVPHPLPVGMNMRSIRMARAIAEVSRGSRIVACGAVSTVIMRAGIVMRRRFLMRRLRRPVLRNEAATHPVSSGMTPASMLPAMLGERR